MLTGIEHAKRLAVYVASLALLAGCATTQFAGTSVSELSDEQLVAELQSAANELGVQADKATMLTALTPSPQYVVASSTTFTTGQFDADYRAFSMPSGHIRGNLAGNFSAASSTSYDYIDANATQRAGYQIAAAIARARANANRDRLQAVAAEIDARRDERQHEAQATIDDFFGRYPDMRARRPLVGSILPWVAAASPDLDARAQLEQTRQVALSLNQGPGLDGRWFGVINQVTTRPDGRRVSFERFAVLTFEQNGEEIEAEGYLASGEAILLYGRTDGYRFQAVAANRTAGINVEMAGQIMPGQITAEYQGYGGDGRIRGGLALYR